MLAGCSSWDFEAIVEDRRVGFAGLGVNVRISSSVLETHACHLVGLR